MEQPHPSSDAMDMECSGQQGTAESSGTEAPASFPVPAPVAMEVVRPIIADLEDVDEETATMEAIVYSVPVPCDQAHVRQVEPAQNEATAMLDLEIAAAYACELPSASEFSVHETFSPVPCEIVAVEESKQPEPVKNTDSDDESIDSIGEADAVVLEQQRSTLWAEEETEYMPNEVLRTKHEVQEAVLEVDLNLSPLDKIHLAGSLIYLVEAEHTILVQSLVTNTPLGENSLLCLDDRSIVGKIHEIFGPVTQPFYVVRWKQGDPPPITVGPGEPIFFVEGHYSYVDPAHLQAKGCDASNLFDEELNEEEMDFSDDEKEMNAKRFKKRGRPHGTEQPDGYTAGRKHSSRQPRESRHPHKGHSPVTNPQGDAVIKSQSSTSIPAHALPFPSAAPSPSGAEFANGGQWTPNAPAPVQALAPVQYYNGYPVPNMFAFLPYMQQAMSSLMGSGTFQSPNSSVEPSNEPSGAPNDSISNEKQ